MNGDQRSGGQVPGHPAFYPPLQGYPPGAHPMGFPEAPPAPEPADQGAIWNVAVILAGAVLLVSAFLPWAQAQLVIDLFGRRLSRELGTLVGIEADNVVVAVPVLAVAAMCLAAWGIIGRDGRVSVLAAVPGGLALVACWLFVLRLDDLTGELTLTDPSLGYEIAVVGGWYLAVAMALLVVGFSLARPFSARLGVAVRARRQQPGTAESPDAPDAPPVEEDETPRAN